MCGRFDLKNPDTLYKRFGVTKALSISLIPNSDVRPSQSVPIVFADREIELMKWGLIPSWAKDEKVGYKMINARAEGIESKPSFKNPFHTQRCLVPATGFYEWKDTSQGKVKYYFHLKNNSMFAFAGLYDVWRNNEGRGIKTFTIITTRPNSVVQNVHDRMPVILRKEDEEVWLNPDEIEDTRLLPLLEPYPAKEMVRN